MSILSALKQHNGSIDDLAALPQTMIMQMAQRREISADMVAPILARKAEMTESAARSKAMRSGGGPKTSIMEQIMQKNAESEHPVMTDGRDMGIAQLPVQEPQYAGGGIVAFAEGGDTSTEEDNGPYGSWGKAVKEWWKSHTMGSPEALERQGAMTPDQAKAALEKQAGIKALVEKGGVTPTPMPSAAPSAATAPTPIAKEAGVKGLTGEKKMGAAPTTTGVPQADTSNIDKLMAELSAQYKTDPAAAKSLRDDVRNQALLEAGLNIMGGTSPYAFANIGAGGAAGARSYGEGMKGIRAEEADKLKQLSTLGLKGQELKLEAKKLGITEKHYDQWYKAQMAQVGEGAAARNALAKETLEINRQKAADTALNAAGYPMLAMSKKPEAQQKAAAMKQQIYSQYGIGVSPTGASGGTGAFNYVPGKGLVPVQ